MRFRRVRTEGGRYFFTVVTLDRRPILIDHVDRLREAFHRTMAARPFALEAVVILPDHLHAIWRLPAGDADYSSRWAQLKHYFSTGLSLEQRAQSRMRKRERGIWQRRFWEHLIRDEKDWRRHMDYIHHNPVKHGYCTSPEAWPYSSFRRHVRNGLYAPDWRHDEALDDTAPHG
jgi:putative transposase